MGLIYRSQYGTTAGLVAARPAVWPQSMRLLIINVNYALNIMMVSIILCGYSVELGDSADHMMIHADIVDGGHYNGQLSYDFYKDSCPSAYTIVEERVKAVIHEDPSEAAGILRIFFHDCFVQGCDASILLVKPTTEQIATPNNASLRASSLKLLDEIKEAIELSCPGIVSCADIISLSTATAIQLVGGPNITFATGRRDSNSAASNQTVVANLPAPTLNISALKQNFQNHNLDVADLVALSGGHTIGQAHCRIVDLQISPTISTDLNAAFGANLSRICLPANDSAKGKLTVHLDFITKDIFDNSYFKNVLAKTATFHTDAALLNATDTKELVEEYANDQMKFFQQFEVSMVKLSELGVLTGDNGVIRKMCSVPN